MIAKGQSPQAQAARLAVNCCPIHGCSMGQVSSWLSSITRDAHQFGDYTLECCPRSDCDIVAKRSKAALEHDGPSIPVTAADVHPDLWAMAAAWLEHKRAKGPKTK